ncbi:hypothetical protein KSF_077790 [Reticulibacter mediterranei]|uniref:Uncharacterized protein n=1 Tax=Reticulibacter mediterranei TaxID=2778369 RepID=A0A8J3IYU3_9CHLR|nr:hypothetical protein [Reticulibacter mediterranei]GHO97731.1 hypothetical protein KSF_077790 [Reticulibacter mediterranei]
MSSRRSNGHRGDERRTNRPNDHVEGHNPPPPETPQYLFDATFLNGGPGQVNGELRQVNGEPRQGTSPNHPFDATFLNGELRQVNGEHRVRLDAGERLATTLTSEYPSSFSIDHANRSVHIRIHDEQGRVLYSRTLSNDEILPNERFTIFDSDRSRYNVIEYYGANNTHFSQLHQTIYAGDIDTIMRNYDQVMNGELNDEARGRQLNSYLLERHVYRISINSFRVTSYDSDGNEEEHIYRLGR